MARAALVSGGAKDIKALITIASPHLGTYRAEQALDATDIPFPLSMVTDFFGGQTHDIAKRSRGLFVDLVRPTGKSTRIAEGAQHGLEMIDGSVIVNVLAGLKR